MPREAAPLWRHCPVALAVASQLTLSAHHEQFNSKLQVRPAQVAYDIWLLVKHSLALHAYWMPFGAQINSYAKMTGCEITLNLVIMSQAQSSSSLTET